jgi:hypothetical protein
VPPTKVGSVLAALPQIQAGQADYCWCTHGWVDEQSNAGIQARP